MSKPIPEKELVQKMLTGDTLSLSRLITLIENRKAIGQTFLKDIDTIPGNAHILGITGPPGAGKSTILNGVIKLLRQLDNKVAVIAIDPSSPFSGGALFGDRIRMQEHTGDEDVFIRSMGTRGKHGGLSIAVYEIIKILDVFGFDKVIIETVGVGQSELDIMSVADTVAVVLVPESGDYIQTMKAGITEIGDIYVINKSDRKGAVNLSVEMRNILSMKDHDQTDRNTPVLLTDALSGEGISDLLDHIESHYENLKKSGLIHKKRIIRKEKELMELLKSRVVLQLHEKLKSEDLQRILTDARNNRISIYDAADLIISKVI